MKILLSLINIGKLEVKLSFKPTYVLFSLFLMDLRDFRRPGEESGTFLSRVVFGIRFFVKNYIKM